MARWLFRKRLEHSRLGRWLYRKQQVHSMKLQQEHSTLAQRCIRSRDCS